MAEFPAELDDLRYENQLLIKKLRNRQAAVKESLKLVKASSVSQKRPRDTYKVPVDKTGDILDIKDVENLPKEARSPDHKKTRVVGDPSGVGRGAAVARQPARLRVRTPKKVTFVDEISRPEGELQDTVQGVERLPRFQSTPLRKESGKVSAAVTQEGDDDATFPTGESHRHLPAEHLADQQPHTPHLYDEGNDQRANVMVKEPPILRTPVKRRTMVGGGSNHSNQSAMTVGELQAKGREDDQPLLGYDWIAGLLDNDASSLDRSEGFFEELREFRRVNREECEHKAHLEVKTSQFSRHKSPLTPAGASDDTHNCVHSYRLNSRLFPTPMHSNFAGDSECAICKSTRSGEETSESPAYVRVSVPRSSLVNSLRVKPHRRRSFDPSDTVGLSGHTLAGWQNSCPSTIPAASNLDLKSSVRFQPGVSSTAPSVSVNTSMATRTGPAATASRTRELLNTSHAMRYSLQVLEQERTKHKPAHSTNYPAL
ncbi:uncharacterized protein [Branchiostoma lanceolatum]|uniref:uncharacterized protein n=1 Tax=Branchiostoma lanceolatum TaxID=7740 RepID=UPI003454B8FB